MANDADYRADAIALAAEFELSEWSVQVLGRLQASKLKARDRARYYAYVADLHMSGIRRAAKLMTVAAEKRMAMSSGSGLASESYSDPKSPSSHKWAGFGPSGGGQHCFGQSGAIHSRC
jgi:hypothetical protein